MDGGEFMVSFGRIAFFFFKKKKGGGGGFDICLG